MIFDLSGWAILIHLAAITQIIGYFYRDQIILRTLLFIGTLFYLAYYYLFQDVPLWDAMFWSAIMGAVNLTVLLRLLSDKLLVFNDDEQARVFRLFYGFTPGMFRKLVNEASFIRAENQTELTNEGESLDKLYFVVNGGMRVCKNGKEFDYLPGAFVGEVVFLSGGFASATVTIPKGATYYVWGHKKLESLLKRDPEIKTHLNALLNRDLAHKVRFS